jgi:hypothetical protein
MRFRISWTAPLAACFAASLFFLVYPIYVIRPFRHQGAGEIRLALEVLGLRPIAMAVAVALASISAMQYWRAGHAGWKRTLAVTAAVAVIGFAGLSRINVYEQMFHPASQPEFIEAAAMKLDGNEKVLAIRIGDKARAYPIRSISYHHIVNDRLDGVPIVATY